MRVYKHHSRKKRANIYLLASFISLVVAVGIIFAGMKIIEKAENASILKYEVIPKKDKKGK
jgi:hypothetical protein